MVPEARLGRFPGLGRFVARVSLTLLLVIWGIRVTMPWWWPDNEPAQGEAMMATGITVLGVVAALLMARRPRNRFLWLMTAAPLVTMISVLADLLAKGLGTTGGAFSFFSELGFFAAVSLFAAFGLLLYPNGILPSPRWRPVAAAAGFGTLAVLGWGLTRPCITIRRPGTDRTVPPCDAPLEPWFERIDNPLGLDFPGGASLWGVLGAIGAFLVLAAMIAGAVSLVWRYRRARGIERQQLKVLALVVLVLMPFWIAGVALENTPAGNFLGSLLGVAVAPLLAGAMAVAVLRYRLFEIDRLISRTVSHLVVTGLALGVFALVVVVPASSFGDQGTPPWLVATATLAAAGVFRPLLRRVQRLVDRRFNRARYDAQLVVDELAIRLRDRRELEAVTKDLTTTAAATVHPDRLGVWVRV